MIKRKTWSDGEVSAYLDDELDATTREAFETALVQAPDLRRQVDDMREVVALMRTAPLREPPRNYLLTPEMVTETSLKRVERRRTPLLWMRLATSLTAAAFVVTVGLSVVSRGASPAMVTQDNAKIEPLAVGTQEVEKAVEAEAPGPVMEAAPSERSAEKAPSPEDEAAFAPLPQDAPAASAFGEGVGGETGEEKAAPMMLEAAPALEESAVDAAKAPPGTPTPEGNAQPETPRVMRYNTTETETVAYEPELADDREGDVSVQVAQLAPAWLLSGILGVATLVLIGLTIWMSRRR